jgi:hypothetical protein
MLPDVKVKHPSNHALNLLYARVTKFENVLAVAAYQVVVLAVLVALFIYSHVSSKLVARYKVTCNQVLYSIVNGGTAYTVLFIFHSKMQFLCIEMFINRIYFIQYGKPLRCFAAAALFKIFCKNFFDRVLRLLLFHVLSNAEVTNFELKIKMSSAATKITC